MIKGIESDVGNIDLKLQTKIVDKCLRLYCFELQRIGHIIGQIMNILKCKK